MTAAEPSSGDLIRCLTAGGGTGFRPPKRVASILGHEGTRTTATVYVHGQEVIDMTGDEFETYGNQFGNQPAEGASSS
jgi:hypothetical protein